MSNKRVINPKPDTVRKRNDRSRKRNELIKSLGGVCAYCGTTKNLTFDHIYGRDWDVRSVHGEKRLRIYRIEATSGLIQLLCLSCNSRKGYSGSDYDESF